MTPSRSEFLTVRGLRIHVRHWGNPDAPALFMLHGWMDVSASFQFVVDCLQREWHVIAPDWRGFGLSERAHSDTYWFPDYVADLDAILQHYSPDDAVNLLAHSMGGNVACLYAGARPQRIARLINLEGFGMPASHADQAPARYASWLEQLRNPLPMRAYPSLNAVAARLQKTNPRLPDERAAFLARHWAGPKEDGSWEILGDPAHRQATPLLYHLDEVLACWRAITAPMLWIEGQDTDMWKWMKSPEQGRLEIDSRLAVLAQVDKRTIADAGHMLHHDQPAVLAALIEEFLA